MESVNLRGTSGKRWRRDKNGSKILQESVRNGKAIQDSQSGNSRQQMKKANSKGKGI